MLNKETYCSYPFNTFFLGSDGCVKFCCSSRKDLGNINEQPLEEIIQGDVAQSVREHILSNTWEMEHCAQCHIIESRGGKSERVNAIPHFWDEHNSEVKDKTFFKLTKLDIRWSNICNLSCNYCYPFFSSQWAKILNDPVNNNNKEANEKTFEYIEKNKNHIEHIQMLGGEPLLQRQNIKLFEMMKDQEIKYYILTNLSVDLEKNEVFKKILEMKNPKLNVVIGVSFENIGDRFEYVRNGAKWDVFVKNLEIISKHGFEINAHPVFCIYSGLYMKEYYDWCYESGFFSDVFWTNLINIAALDIFSYNNEVIQKVIDEIDRVLDKYKIDYNTTESHLISYKDHLVQKMEKRNNTIVTTSRADEKFKKEFKLFNDNLEGKWHPNKKHSIFDLWPDLLYLKED